MGDTHRVGDYSEYRVVWMITLDNITRKKLPITSLVLLFATLGDAEFKAPHTLYCRWVRLPWLLYKYIILT
jgi:hypothetical protein